jgi:hypothetical protein
MHGPQPASVADAAAPHDWGLKGSDTNIHTCHARRLAPQVHGNCTIGRACSRADGHTRMQPMP